MAPKAPEAGAKPSFKDGDRLRYYGRLGTVATRQSEAWVAANKIVLIYDGAGAEYSEVRIDDALSAVENGVAELVTHCRRIQTIRK